MRMLHFLMTFSLVTLPAVAQTVAAPEVSMRLSSDSILLGEPVWALVTARNNSAAAVLWNPGDYGRSPAELPVTAAVSDAARGNGKHERCSLGGGGDFYTGGSTTLLAPGDSATWRYLLEGDFHFDRAGGYHVELTSHPGGVFRVPRDTTPAGSRATVTQALTLQVLPRDDVALLARERQMAAEADPKVFIALTEAQMRAEQFLDQSNMAQMRARSDADRAIQFRQLQNADQIRRGLAMHPEPGMEAVFAQWLKEGMTIESWAIVGLKSLNTAESRAVLAELATTPDQPNHYLQDAAVEALGEMGDRRYYSLMVQLLSSQNDRVRRAAVSGVGYLGGDSAVATLVALARQGNAGEQEDDMRALGNTQSLKGVRALIDLMAAPAIAYPMDAQGWLFVLTHHRLESVTPQRTPAQTF